MVDDMIGELLALRLAPALDPYTGPAILAPEAAGVLFHEAVGHRLEGERQNDDKDGRTFKGQIGKAILPSFLSIFDDATLANFGGMSLNGEYRYDDQGVPAQRTLLVESGVLRSFLLSRAPVSGFAKSNGHGRSSPGRDPVARMANLVVQSQRTLPAAKLKEALLAEVRRQQKPFGLVIKDVTGGNTDTSGYAYQAFKGQPRLVYKVDAKTGEETLVRGVEIVGTPLTSINKIVATGSETRVFNGYCGAESGFVPVSTVAPAILISEIELQRTRKDTGRPPVLPSPWANPPVTAVKR
jgi:predicted Zn-dependent protease